MKRIFGISFLILAVVCAFAFFSSDTPRAGMEDRFSGIELRKEPNNYAAFPVITTPSGNPDTNYGWIYVKDNDDSVSDLYFENESGTVFELTPGSVVAKTANYTVTAGDSGKTFTNTGATAQVVLTLPEASTVLGRPFHFVVLAAYTVEINPDDADQLISLTNAAGDAVENATAGSVISLKAASASQWVQIGDEVGTWTDVN